MEKDGVMEAGGYRLEFRHQQGEWPVPFKKKNKDLIAVCRQRTQCFIVTAATPRSSEVPTEYVAMGEAYCSPDDTFDHEIGRQHALLEALRKNAEFRKKKMLGGGPNARHLFTAYTRRPGALPWVIDAQGHADVEKLQAARRYRKNVMSRQREIARLMKLASQMGALTPLPLSMMPPLE